MMETRKVGVLCVCKKLDGSEIVGRGCKLLRIIAKEQEWNGMWIVGLLSKELNEELISVSRKNDQVMSIELVLDEMVVNIMCAYTPQVGYRMKKKRVGDIWIKSSVRHRMVRA